MNPLLETLLIMLLFSMPVIIERVPDPSSSIWHSKEETRNLDCNYMPRTRAHALYPEYIPEPPARGIPGEGEGQVMVCTRRLMRVGERAARDEEILSSLQKIVADFAEAATAVGGNDVTWYVDTFYPDARVAAKVSVATRTTIAERGRRVSDRVPLLAAGDLAVLARLELREAYPLACARYHAEGALKPGEAFLGVTLLDARETQLHAGVCIDGTWRWIR